MSAELDAIIDGTLGVCEGHCERRLIRVRTPSQTQYCWDGKGDDPNRDLMLCPEESEEYTQVMKEQWASYWSGCL